MSLTRKYEREIKSWDWAAIVSEAKANTEETDDGETEGRCYLGSVLHLYPSGKYYMPFACSNVDACPTCKGSGQAKRTLTCQYCKGRGQRVAEDYMSLDGIAQVCGHPVKLGDTFACNACKGSGQTHPTCNTCQGVGSLETYRDQVFSETLEEIAGEHGGYITGSDGDGCDVVFGICVDVEETETTS